MTKINILPELIKKLNNQNIINDILNGFDQESIDVYLFLKKEYNKCDVDKNFLFQFVYRSFYRLDNAGLTPELKLKYFNLMSNKNSNLKEILSILSNYKTLKKLRSVQFSFATKLMNTLNQDLPIYDSQVAKVLKLKNYYDKDITKRIDNCIVIYEILKSDIRYLLKSNLKIIPQFRSKFKINEGDMCDVKVLDFVLWRYGNVVGQLK